VLVSDADRLADPVPAACGLPRGSAVLLRHYGDPARVELARTLRAVCRARRLELWIGGDPAFAQVLGADGIHFSERALPACGRWNRPHPQLRITAAAHSWRSIVRAARAGADAVLLSPLFATRSHPGAPGLGRLRFAQLAHRSPIPVYALGGIDEHTAPALAGSGVAGIAAIGAFVDTR
jgi:thiamine-phosphate pyrophosphorylase